MHMSPIRTYRLAPRGEGGLACDRAGVALGPADLVRVSEDAGRRSYEMPPRMALARILGAAYGPQPESVVLRIHRGLRRAAAAMEAGDLCLAGIEAVLLRLPDLTRRALAEIAELEKSGSWENQPRVPAGQSDGGQWTSESADGAARVILAAGPEEDAESRRSNGPPDDLTSLEDVFPSLRDAPSLAVPLAPIDGFLGVSALADEANLEATLGQYRALVADIKQIDPTFVDSEILPAGGIDALSWQGRTNLINSLRVERAAAYYRILGDVGPLQVETLRFLQRTVDDAYEEAVSAADAGRLQPRLSREEAIGNRVDFVVRSNLKDIFDEYKIAYGPSTDITINDRDYERSDSGQSYRIPDARIRDVSFDWTLSPKTISSPQIQGFFRTESSVRAVIIVRPSGLGRDSTYLISGPADIPSRR